MTVGDMHFAVVAHGELEAEGRPTRADMVATKLGWFTTKPLYCEGPGGERVEVYTGSGQRLDVERAETALLAAAERGLVGSPR